MCLGIGRIGELRRNEAVRNLLCQLVSLFDGSFHALCAFGQHQLCAKCLHQVAAFDGHRLRHGNNQTVASRRCDSSQTNASVSGGRFDQHAFSRGDESLCLSFVQHCLCNTILDAAGRIEKLRLSQKRCLQLFFLFNVSQFEQRCPANEICDLLKNLCHEKPSFLRVKNRYEHSRPPAANGKF